MSSLSPEDLRLAEYLALGARRLRRRGGLLDSRVMFRWLAIFVALGLLLACAPAVRVGAAYDPTANHEQYRTFAMLEPNRPIPSENTDIDPFVLQRLRQIVYSELRARGLAPVPRAEAELVVGVAASRDRRTMVYSSGPYVYDSLYGPPMWSERHYVAQISEGVVVVDLVDRKKNAVVWRGTGVHSLDDAKFTEEDLRLLVTSILAEYPPGEREKAAPE